MHLVPHAGQMPRSLQLNATTVLRAQVSQVSRRKPVARNVTAEVCNEFVLDELRQTIYLGGERFILLAHQLVERRLFGTAALVLRCAGLLRAWNDRSMISKTVIIYSLLYFTLPAPTLL